MTPRRPRNRFARLVQQVAAAIGVAAVGYALGSSRHDVRRQPSRVYVDQPRDAMPTPHEAALQPGWSRPLPTTLPRPTYWPAVFGLGIAFVGWGLATHYFVSMVGLLLVLLGVIGWIVDLVLESGGDRGD